MQFPVIALNNSENHIGTDKHIPGTRRAKASRREEDEDDASSDSKRKGM